MKKMLHKIYLFFFCVLISYIWYFSSLGETNETFQIWRESFSYTGMNFSFIHQVVYGDCFCLNWKMGHCDMAWAGMAGRLTRIYRYTQKWSPRCLGSKEIFSVLFRQADLVMRRIVGCSDHEKLFLQEVHLTETVFNFTNKVQSDIKKYLQHTRRRILKHV